MVYTNVRSFLSKRAEICSLVSSSSSNIVVLTETWLSGDVTDDEILTDLPNFDVFRNDRKGAVGEVF